MVLVSITKCTYRRPKNSTEQMIKNKKKKLKDKRRQWKNRKRKRKYLSIVILGPSLAAKLLQSLPSLLVSVVKTAAYVFKVKFIYIEIS
jgi:hypothetical protein